jgi:DNA-binding transcriptional LysR family regulator
MMWPAVELREIRVFLTLSDELHFARTAERLHLTPSRVSQILRELEAKLGVQLVRRTSRRVELTARGAQFRDEAGAVYEQLIEVVERTRAAAGDLERPLRVGLFSGVAAGPHFPRIVRTFESRHPQCAAVVSEIPLGQSLVGLLERGEADLIASWLPHGQTDLIIGPTLIQEPRVLAVGPGHPLAGREAVSLEEVADYPVVQMHWVPTELHETWLPSKTPNGRSFRYHKVDDRDRGRLLSEMGYLVASGRIVHPTVRSLTKIFDHLDIVYVPITDMPLMRSALVWLHAATHPALREFVHLTSEVLRSTRARPDRATTQAR